MKLRHIIFKILYIYATITTVFLLFDNIFISGRFMYDSTYVDFFLTKYMPKTIYSFLVSLYSNYGIIIFLTYVFNYYFIFLLKVFNKIKIFPFAVIYTLAILNFVYQIYFIMCG